MPDIDAIEAINFEQLATITDRLLLRRGSLKRRPSYQRIEVGRVDLAPELALRPRASDHWRRFATTALVTALISVSAAIVTLL